MQSIQIKLAQICLANAFRDDNNETYRYCNRHLRMVDLFNTMFNNDVDIISVKEIRRTTNTSHTFGTTDEIVFPHTIWKHFLQMTNYFSAVFGQAKNQSSETYSLNPFYYGQLYNPKKFVLLNSYVFNLCDKLYGSEFTSPNAGTVVVVGLYAPILQHNNHTDLKNKFFLESHHFPIKEGDKQKFAEYLYNDFEQQRNKTFEIGAGEIIPTIRVGDFNIFSDKQEHVLQLEYLNKKYEHVNKLMNIVDKQLVATGDQVNYTFVPFPHDKMPNGQENSYLDYVFVDKSSSRIVPNKMSIVFDETPIALTDHKPLVCEFTLATE
jgi:hypothetical protein